MKEEEEKWHLLGKKCQELYLGYFIESLYQSYKETIIIPFAKKR